MRRTINHFYPSQVWQHCPYCGSPNITWSGGTHCMQCSTCGRAFYINASSAVVAIIENEHGELLFTRRKNEPAKNMLDLPGGFVNLNETAEDAVRREIKEELNIYIDDLRFFGTFPNRYLYGDIVYFTLDIAFRCRVNDFSTLTAGDDVLAYEFIKLNDIKLDKIGLDSIQKITEKIIIKGK